MRDADSESDTPTGRVELQGFDFDLEADELRDGAGEVVTLRPHCLACCECSRATPAGSSARTS